jgi:putative membrane protein
MPTAEFLTYRGAALESPGRKELVLMIPQLAMQLTCGSLLPALGAMIVFAMVGIAMAIVGYRIFDKCTPGDLNNEILQNKNVAAAIIAGAVILGVCLIVAAAMIG